ncbi:ATP-dependent Clp protease proteolytic subunit [Dirofilaria immitis]
MAKKRIFIFYTIVMSQTIGKSQYEEQSNRDYEAHVVLLKYNFTSKSYLQKCGKPLLYTRDQFRKKLVVAELSNERCIIRILSQYCQSNIEITLQAKLGNRTVIYDDESKNIAVNSFSVKKTNYRFIRMMKELDENKKKDFRRNLRYYLKWVYLCLIALTIIICAATISVLTAELYFQHQYYGAKNKSIKLIINKEFLNRVQLTKSALRPIGSGWKKRKGIYRF